MCPLTKRQQTWLQGLFQRRIYNMFPGCWVTTTRNGIHLEDFWTLEARGRKGNSIWNSLLCQIPQRNVFRNTTSEIACTPKTGSLCENGDHPMHPRIYMSCCSPDRDPSDISKRHHKFGSRHTHDRSFRCQEVLYQNFRSYIGPSWVRGWFWIL